MKIDNQSQAWLLTAAYIENRLAEHRTKLEGNLGWEDTICLRAQMRELRLLLAEVEPDDVQYITVEVD